ncbi:glycosyltransferase family 4 protein [bacterium]|nr:glycosyltransferase family 4 protein [bacterium]
MAERLSFLTVIDNFHPIVGGAEHHAQELGAELTSRGHRVDVLTQRKDSSWPAEEVIDGMRVFRFDEVVPPRPLGRLLYERSNARAARAYADRHLAAEPYDALLLFPIDAAFGVARSRMGRNALLFYNFTTPLSDECWLRARGMLAHEPSRLRRMTTWLSAAWSARYRGRNQRDILARCHGVLCPSRYSRDLLLEWMPAAQRQAVHVIPHGVDGERFQPAEYRDAVRARLGWAPDDLVIFTARRLVPRMGLGALIRGLGLASEQNPSLRLVVAGQGPLRGRLEALARRAGGRTEFAGLIPAEHLPAYYQAADLTIVPSRDLEAFGLVLLESLACGTPVLATQRCAMPEVLAPLDSRLLIPRDDAQAMAEAILGPGAEIAGDNSYRERCRDYAIANYSWPLAADAFEDIVRDQLARRTVE